jgi:response regulator RpfG family c-di-GMP phosphodiesterase
MSDTTSPKMKVLCVDDEPNVLSGLALHLRKRYDLVTATSGADALEILEQYKGTAVIISDMRMPVMDGAVFLSRSRDVAPDAVRLLLTGQTDMNSAIAAVNHGQIFRFLAKPCPPAALIAAVEAAIEQHRLITSERVLLEQTVRGSIKALTDVLALTNPAAFGCATRIRQLTSELVTRLGLHTSWQVDVAAMLCQLGSVALPAETAARLYAGERLTDEDTQMVDRMPAVAEQLLGQIPRLDDVVAMLSAVERPFHSLEADSDAQEQLRHHGGEVLKVAKDFDALEVLGNSPARTVDIMRARSGRYDPDVLSALEGLRAGEGSREKIVEITLSAVRVGMVFAEDVKSADGMLLAARGCEVTTSFVARMRNVRADIGKTAIRVVLPNTRLREAS